MAKYDVKVVVEYNYNVEADSSDEAGQEGWKYENYAHFAEVVSIDVSEDDSEFLLDDEEDDEDESYYDEEENE